MKEERRLQAKAGGLLGNRCPITRATADRRTFLATASAMALATSMGIAGRVAASDTSWRGEPFSDGTFFDDGTGWVD
jgi:hypothetical protein